MCHVNLYGPVVLFGDYFFSFSEVVQSGPLLVTSLILKKKKLFITFIFIIEGKKQNINLAFTLIKNLSQFVMAKAQWE